MPNRMVSFMMIMLFCLGSLLHAAAPSVNTTHAQQLKWWKEQRFGMFIHWGPVSQTGKEISWSRGDVIPIATYDTLYKTFNPTGFNADDWVQTAIDAGMKYLVFTAKHHDGFCEFNSALTNYKITAPECPFGRDVSKELADACHSKGMGLGFYYSPTDWYLQPQISSSAYITYYTNQVADELLSNYGRVDLVWYDLGSVGANSDSLLKRMRQKQPWVLVNERGGMGNLGDFYTPEQTIGAFDTTRPWESCMTTNGFGKWSWCPDGGVKSLKEIIGMIVGCADGGGNCLLNVGPRPDGIMDPPVVSRLMEIGNFMKLYGESIYETQGGPIKKGVWGGTTHKGNTMYVHLTPFKGSVTIPPVNATILSTTCLTGGTAAVEQSAQSIKITMPIEDIDSIYTILKMELDYSQPLSFSVNVSKGKTTTQSSTYPNYTANLAVDGDVSGSTFTHTNNEAGAWWMVDLGATYPISTINIFNRNAFMDRLGDYNVILLDSNSTQVWLDHETTYPNPLTTVDVNGRSARYVKIQLTGTNYLSLAEVEVFDMGDSTHNTRQESENGRNVSRALMHIRPNPANSLLSIQINGLNSASHDKGMTLRIFDIHGRLLKDFSSELGHLLAGRGTGSGIFQWNASAYADGIYLVKANFSGKTLAQRITLLR